METIMRRLVQIRFPALACLLVACTTTPDPVREAVVEPVTVAQVHDAPERFRHSRVRWGGTIVDVRNEPALTVVEVLSLPLDSAGAPEPDALGRGRFRARVPGFLDPSEYSAGRWLTVVGTVGGAEKGRVGDYPYTFPLVEVEHHRLWRSRAEIDPPRYYPDPWWYPWPYPYRWWRYPYWW